MEQGFNIRPAKPTDHGPIMEVMPTWWGGRDLRYGLPRLFMEHFVNTSFVMEHEGRMVGFIVAFLSPARPGEGYAHFLGVDPAFQGRGLGRRLYERFFEVCRANGRGVVRACTSPVNLASVRFHQKMGFSLAPGDAERDGIPFIRDYNRPGDDKVEFIKHLD